MPYRYPLLGLLGLLVLLPLLVFPGCQTLQEIAALREVDFSIGDVRQADLAGVDLDRIRSYEDVRPGDLLRLTGALSSGDLPLSFTLNLLAENPAANSTAARLVQMDWTLYLEDRETISGVFNDEVVLPAGETVGIPISMRLDLLDFFNDNIQDLVDLALSVSGAGGGAPKEIRLRAVPTIQTPLGPITYPQPITIVTREVG